MTLNENSEQQFDNLSVSDETVTSSTTESAPMAEQRDDSGTQGRTGATVALPERLADVDSTTDLNVAPTLLSEAPEGYFDDDEQFLGDDVSLSDDPAIGIFQQLDGVVSWELVNFYDDEGEPKSRRSLRTDPPILKFSSSNGDVAEFVVTRELARTLSDVFSNIHRAYFGVKPKTTGPSMLSQEGMRNKGEQLMQWAIERPVRSLVLVLLVLFVVVSPFLFL